MRGLNFRRKLDTVIVCLKACVQNFISVVEKSMKDFAHTSVLSRYTLQTGIILKFLPHA